MQVASSVPASRQRVHPPHVDDMLAAGEAFSASHGSWLVSWLVLIAAGRSGKQPLVEAAPDRADFQRRKGSD